MFESFSLPVTVIIALLCAAIVLLLFRLKHAQAKLRALQLELEEARRQETLGTLAAGIAHDFNNILGSIMGFGALLTDDLIAQPESREMAQQIVIAAKRGQGIVMQLMNYSKRNIKEDKRIHAPMSLDALIREHIALAKPSIRSSSNLVYTNNALDDTVRINASQVGRAFLNLCVNADHAIGTKTGRIDITLDNLMLAEPVGNDTISVTEDQGCVRVINGRLNVGNHARISIRDNGEGMAPDVAQKIFDPFFTTKDAQKGTGLGLAAVEGIMRSHNGAILMTSEKFKGTTFELVFPINIDEEEPVIPTAETASQ